MANISGPRLIELEAAEKRLQDLLECKAIQPFADALTQAMGTIAANTPFTAWPVQWQQLYRAIARDMPMAARLYKDRLPGA